MRIGFKYTNGTKFIIATILFLAAATNFCSAQDNNEHTETAWTESFNLEKCNFASTGRNSYFILEPGYQLVLEGIDEVDSVNLTITVLNETNMIGAIETRVVEERESTNGELDEISRNFFAFCTQTGSIFYFGEEVDIYEDGILVNHSGAWRADSSGARAGLMMPGIILIGARYYQEIAPDIAMDRAEIISNSETLQTAAGKFDHCLKTEETTPLEPKAKEYKIYAPGIGLIKDENLLLVKSGFVK